MDLRLRTLRIAVCATALTGALAALTAGALPAPAATTPRAVPGAPLARAAKATCETLGSGRSWLTGRTEPNGTVLAVKIDNLPVHAWPQAGLDRADDVFVEEIENGYTRHVALFASDYPRRIGPVRSARETDLALLPSFGRVGLAYSGAAGKVQTQIDAAPLVGMREASPASAFSRDAKRGRAKGGTHNLFGDGLALAHYAQAHGAGTVARQVTCFGPPAHHGGHPASRIEVIWPRQSVYAEWRPRLHRFVVGYGYPAAPSGRWVRMPTRVEGGGGVAADNVVVLFTTRRYVRVAYQGKPNQTPVPLTATLGSGAAVVLRDGRAYQAHWSRAAAAAPLRLTSPSGRALPLHPGVTWTLLASQGRRVALTAGGTRTRPGTQLVTSVPANRTLPGRFAALLPSW